MEKTIHFRQVDWVGTQENLPALLHTALAARPNVDDTTFQRSIEILQVRHRSGTAAEMKLHFSSHIQGARKPITPQAVAAPAADLGEAAPPTNSEFTEREIALVARPDRIGYVAAGFTQPNKVTGAIQGLLELHHGAPIANRLFLSARADAAMVSALMQSGVDRLDFGLSLPAAEADEIVAGQPLSFVESISRSVGQEIMTRLTADHEAEDIDLLEQMKAKLRLQLRKRKPTVEQVKSLTEIASQAIESDEQFRIRTVNGTEFTRDKLLLKSTFTHPDTTTLDYVTSWAAIVSFLNQV
jgi:hypothetical protein